ncbi:MAG: hypothetical protein GY730_08750 [bacterium]|nr:hypothetical protein [bacterium]
MFRNLLRGLFLFILKTEPGSLFFFRVVNFLFVLPSYDTGKKYSKIYKKWILQGILNNKVIPYHLDRVWPFWVYKQFSPKSASYSVNAFPMAAINMTYRNWVTLGLPGSDDKVTVDPRGLITPFRDGWSLDFWIADSIRLVSSAHLKKVQQIIVKDNAILQTECAFEKLRVVSEVFFQLDKSANGFVFNKVIIENTAVEDITISFFFSIRPYNPEGLVPIEEIVYLTSGSFIIDNRLGLVLDQKPDNIVCVSFKDGDVSEHYKEWELVLKTRCKDNLASAFVEYKLHLKGGEKKILSVKCPTSTKSKLRNIFQTSLPAYKRNSLVKNVSYIKSLNYDQEKEKVSSFWQDKIYSLCSINIPDKGMQYLFNKNIIHLQNFLAVEKIYAGGFSYREYWVTEAVYMILALHRTGDFQAAEKYINCLPGLRDLKTKSFILNKDACQLEYSGQYIFLIYDHYRFTGNVEILEENFNKIVYLVKMIKNSRIKDKRVPELNGLLPKTESFNQTGIKDHYMWDNYWALAGIESAVEIAKVLEKTKFKHQWHYLKEEYMETINLFIKNLSDKLKVPPFIPVSFNRHYDAGLVHSLSAIYPLGIYGADEELITNTLNIIEKKYMLKDMFFNYTGHAGISITYTLWLAQVYLARKDTRAFEIIKYLVERENGVCNFPETIHPLTGGGSAGDGHSGMATAEYINFVRNVFFVEEGRFLHLMPFIPIEWLDNIRSIIKVRNLPCFFGNIFYTLDKIDDNTFELHIDNEYFNSPEGVKVSFPCEIKKIIHSGVEKTCYKDFIYISAHIKRLQIKI